MNYLNKALDVFNTTIINPIYYILFTSSVIIASSILFQDYKQVPVVDVLGSMVGFLIIIIAIFLLSTFKDIHISLIDLYPTKRMRNEFTSMCT